MPSYLDSIDGHESALGFLWYFGLLVSGNDIGRNREDIFEMSSIRLLRWNCCWLWMTAYPWWNALESQRYLFPKEGENCPSPPRDEYCSFFLKSVYPGGKYRCHLLHNRTSPWVLVKVSLLEKWLAVVTHLPYLLTSVATMTANAFFFFFFFSNFPKIAIRTAPQRNPLILFLPLWLDWATHLLLDLRIPGV